MKQNETIKGFDLDAAFENFKASVYKIDRPLSLTYESARIDEYVEGLSEGHKKLLEKEEYFIAVLNGDLVWAKPHSPCPSDASARMVVCSCPCRTKYLKSTASLNNRRGQTFTKTCNSR